MAFFSLIMLVGSLLTVILAVVVIAIAVRWPAGAAKRAFLAFVIISFLVIPLNSLWLETATLMISSGGYRFGGGQFYYSLIGIQAWIGAFLHLASLVLLITYAVIRRGDAQIEALEPETSKEQAWTPNLSAAQLVGIMRRREWGHLIDLLPFVVIWIVFLSLANALDSSIRLNYAARSFLAAFVFCAPFGFLAYLLLKDLFWGKSLGKWLTGCRVVDANTGETPNAAKLILRNLIFLLFPIGSIVELAVANFRPDRKRLGDLWAGTMVVSESPASVEREAVARQADQIDQKVEKHPLDD